MEAQGGCTLLLSQLPHSFTAGTAMETRSLGRCLELRGTRLSCDYSDLDEEQAESRKTGAGYNLPVPV